MAIQAIQGITSFQQNMDISATSQSKAEKRELHTPVETAVFSILDNEYRFLSNTGEVVSPWRVKDVQTILTSIGYTNLTNIDIDEIVRFHGEVLMRFNAAQSERVEETLPLEVDLSDDNRNAYSDVLAEIREVAVTPNSFLTIVRDLPSNFSGMLSGIAKINDAIFVPDFLKGLQERGLLVMDAVSDARRSGRRAEKQEGKKFPLFPIIVTTILAVLAIAVALSKSDSNAVAPIPGTGGDTGPEVSDPSNIVIPPVENPEQPSDGFPSMEDTIGAGSGDDPVTEMAPPTIAAPDTPVPTIEIPVGPAKPEFTKNYSNAGVPLPEDGVKTASWFAKAVNAASNRSTPNNESSTRMVRPDWVGDPTLSEQFLNYLLEFKIALETGSRLPDIGTMPTGIFFPIIPNEEDYSRKITITEELIKSAVETGTEIRLRNQSQGIVINPSENLLAKAQEEGWTIIRISENGDYIAEADPNIPTGINGHAGSVWAAYGKDEEQLSKALKIVGPDTVFIIY